MQQATEKGLRPLSSRRRRASLFTRQPTRPRRASRTHPLHTFTWAGEGQNVAGTVTILTAAMAQQGKQLYSRLVSEARSVSESACIEALSKALRGAALEGHIRATEKLLIDGADPSIAMSSGWNALHVASAYNQHKVVAALVKADAILQSQGWVDMVVNGVSALYIAAQQGHIQVCRELVNAGASIDCPRLDLGTTPLFVSCQQGHHKVVNVLLQAGADANRPRAKQGQTPAYIASCYGHPKVVALLKKFGARLNQGTYKYGQTPLFIAACYGHDEVVAQLVDAPREPDEDSQIREVFDTFDVDGGGSIGPTEFKELCTQLDPGMNDEQVDTALDELDKDGDGEISFAEFENWWKSLTETQEDTKEDTEEEHDDDESMPNDNEAVDSSECINVNKVDLDKAETRYGQTPLYIAAAKGHAGVVRKLIEAGCDLDKQRAGSGATPIFVAAQKGNLVVVDQLLAAWCDKNQPTNDTGFTPLQAAVIENHVEVVERLLDAGCNLTTQTHAGQTALQLAESWNESDMTPSQRAIIKMLQKHSGLSGGSSMDVDGDTSDASDQTDEEVVNEEANDKISTRDKFKSAVKAVNEQVPLAPFDREVRQRLENFAKSAAESENPNFLKIAMEANKNDPRFSFLYENQTGNEYFKWFLAGAQGIRNDSSMNKAEKLLT